MLIGLWTYLSWRNSSSFQKLAILMKLTVMLIVKPQNLLVLRQRPTDLYCALYIKKSPINYLYIQKQFKLPKCKCWKVYFKLYQPTKPIPLLCVVSVD